MAGFAARNQAAQGTALPLHAKALALSDASGHRAVLVTVDLLGVTAAMRGRISAELERRHSLPSDALMVAASHTHSGPVVDDQLSVAYDLDAEQRARIATYTRGLESAIVQLVEAALASMTSCQVSIGEGETDFAANRRTAFLPPGPVDHAVPVLKIERGGGQPMAIVFGYACHNTTLQATMVSFHGDYAGVAQREIEAANPGVVAMFVAGCGADANPKPRGTIELVELHGRSLAMAVGRTLGRTRSLEARLATSMTWVDLPFAAVPAADAWKARLDDKDPFVQRHARLMLSSLERGSLETAHSEPVQAWRVGDWTLVALGGEVVADYLLRLRREHASGSIWVAGYANDVSCYVPSLRVLREGGYEGGGAMLYYGRPGPFDDTVEERIMKAARGLF